MIDGREESGDVVTTKGRKGKSWTARQLGGGERQVKGQKLGG
ncbi:MAG: hypothetical protein WAL98_21925 [Desulfatiglandaceae bacterium]